MKKKPPKKVVEADESPSLFIGLSFGSGVGWTTGNGEIFGGDKVDPPGLSMSRLLHLAPEVGYYVSPEFLLSVQLRLQLISGATEYHDAARLHARRGLFAGQLRVRRASRARRYFFGEGDFRTYVAGTVGLGTIRHVIGFDSQPHCGANMTSTCIDTVPSGPVFAGVGAGIMYNVSPTFALTFGTNALLGFTKFTFHVDLNAGVAFEF